MQPRLNSLRLSMIFHGTLWSSSTWFLHMQRLGPLRTRSSAWRIPSGDTMTDGDACPLAPTSNSLPQEDECNRDVTPTGYTFRLTHDVANQPSVGLKNLRQLCR